MIAMIGKLNRPLALEVFRATSTERQLNLQGKNADEDLDTK